jgi:hypothetical protein
MTSRRRPVPQCLAVGALAVVSSVLFDGVREAGRYTAAIDPTGLPSRMYFAHLRAGERKFTRRVVVVR